MKSIKIIVVLIPTLLLTTFLIAIYAQIIPDETAKKKSTQEDCNREKLSPNQNIENEKLIDSLSDENLKTNNADKFVENIKVIGSKRIIEAVPNLIGLIDFKYEKPSTNPAVGFGQYTGMISSDYPAVEALAQIGKSSLPALIILIEDEQTKSLKSDNALYTIKIIFRNDLSKAVEFLETSVIDSTTKTGKERLQTAVAKTREEYIKNNTSN